MADANTALIVLASVQGATTFVLAAATGFYAWRTHDISKATRRQAEASAEMTREVREQRLDEHRPFLLLDLGVTEPYPIPATTSWDFPKSQPSKDITLMFPKQVTCRVHNAGRGPAKEVALTFLHPHMGYNVQRKGFLLPDEDWTSTVSVVGPLEAALADLSPVGLREWLEKQGAGPDKIADAYDAALVVGYRGFDGHPWGTYLTVRLTVKSDERFLVDDSRYFISRSLDALGQVRIPLSEEFAL